MKHPNSLADLGQECLDRFGILLTQTAAHVKFKEPALVPAAGERSLLTCEGLMGGKDVELVLVRSRNAKEGKPVAVQETLTYRQDVAGSDLVYDLTGEFLQGKARPFDCDLRERTFRLYALLPFQIESLSVVTRQQAGMVTIEIEFQNALGKRAEGALPCHVELRTPDGMAAWGRYLATSQDGHLKTAAELPAKAPRGRWSLVVRSMLDGKEVTVPIEVGRAARK